MDRSPIEVAQAGPDRLSALAPVFGRAFVSEPMMLWPMGEHGDLVERFTRCFEYSLESLLESGMVWEAGAARRRSGTGSTRTLLASPCGSSTRSPSSPQPRVAASGRR